MVDFADHASDLGVIRLHHAMVHSTDAQMPERDFLGTQSSNRTSYLSNLKLFCHRLAVSRSGRCEAVCHLLRFFEAGRRLLIIELSHTCYIFSRS